DLMVSLLSVGRLAETLGMFDAAERDYSEAHELARRLHERESSAQTRDDLAVTLVALGDIARIRGNTPRAEQLFRDVLSLESAGDVGSDPARAAARATTLERLGRLALERGELERAEPLLNEALALRRAASDRLPSPEMRMNLANVLQW